MSDFFIIDGSSMLSTSYYGNLPKSILFEKDEEKKKELYSSILQTSDGRYTNGIFTMYRTLLSMYKKVKPDFVHLHSSKAGFLGRLVINCRKTNVA